MIPDWLWPCCTFILENDEERAIRRKNDEINRDLRRDKKDHRRQIRILLLGTGESGKSTFLKQMKILHTHGFTKTDKLSFRSIIYSNIIRNMKILVDAGEKLDISIQDKDETSSNVVRKWNREVDLDPASFNDFVPHLIRLWADDGIQKCFSLRGKFQLGESVRYYMQNIDRIKVLDYEPTQDDILWARKRTEDITETRVPIKRVPFSFIDVGGQRAQRAKWFQCFQESINTILFFVSISEYDQTLVEDTNQNRVIEALKVFQYVVCHPAFRDRDVILFFNKNDILIEKIAEGKKVTDYLPSELADNFKGDPLNLTDVQTFFRDLFYRAAQYRMKPDGKGYEGRDDLGIYHHFTVAIDTDNIKRVFDDVRDMVLKENMDQLMLQ